MSETSRRIPVLTYHSIDASASPVSTSAGEFRRQMEALATAGWRTLGIEAFAAGFRKGSWPSRALLLTFDDGYRNMLDHAVPVTADCGFTGVLFVAAERIGGTMAGPGTPTWLPDERLLGWDGVRAVAAAGWTIASHASTHTRLTHLHADALEQELTTSKARIEAETNTAVTALAYPYGAVSSLVEQTAGAHYRLAFGTTLAYATASSRRTNLERIDAYYLRRLPVTQLDRLLSRWYLACRRLGRALARRSM